MTKEYDQFKDVDFLKPPEAPFSETGEWEYRSNDVIDQKILERVIIKKEWPYYSNNNQSFLQGEKNKQGNPILFWLRDW